MYTPTSSTKYVTVSYQNIQILLYKYDWLYSCTLLLYIFLIEDQMCYILKNSKKTDRSIEFDQKMIGLKKKLVKTVCGKYLKMLNLLRIKVDVELDLQ